MRGAGLALRASKKSRQRRQVLPDTCMRCPHSIAMERLYRRTLTDPGRENAELWRYVSVGDDFGIARFPSIVRDALLHCLDVGERRHAICNGLPGYGEADDAANIPESVDLRHQATLLEFLVFEALRECVRRCADHRLGDESRPADDGAQPHTRENEDIVRLADPAKLAVDLYGVEGTAGGDERPAPGPPKDVSRLALADIRRIRERQDDG